MTDYTYTFTGAGFSPTNPNWVETDSYTGSATRTTRGYIDGLGRDIQSVSLTGGQVVVAASSYDSAGRPWKAWKPFYQSGTAMSYVSDAPARAKTKNNNNDYAFTETLYEPSPLARTQELIPMGGETANGSVEQDYGVKEIAGVPYSYTEITDAKGNVSQSFTDGWSRTIYTVADVGGLSDTTGFIYNAKDELTETRPPNYYEPPTGSTANDWIITYAYDHRGNMISKTSSDFGTVRYIYNKANLLRFSQDSVQAEANQVAYISYDELGRITESGVGDYSGVFNAATLDPETTQAFEGDTQDADGNLKSAMAYDTMPDTANTYPWNVFSGELGGFTSQNAKGQVVASMYRYGGEGIPESSGLYGNWFASGTSQTLQAADTLSAANTLVENGAAVTLEAGKAIVLKPPFTAEAGSDFTAKVTPALIGTAGQGISSLTGDNPWQLALHSYDSEGRLATKKIYTGNQRSWDATLTYTYNRLGELTRLGTTIAGQTLYQHYAYNPLGQLTTLTLTTDGTADTEPAEVSYTYMADGQIDSITYRGGTTIDYGYDIQSRLTGINDITSTSGSPFAAEFSYYKNGNINEASFWNPNISTTGSLSSSHRSYTYDYDYNGKNQLTGADYKLNSSNPDHFDVRSLTYDPNGNITGLERYAHTGTREDNLSYSYGNDNNQLSAITDTESNSISWDPETGAFTYDGNGNLKSMSGHPHMTELIYNEQNLPVQITLNSGITQINSYNAEGQRILKEIRLADGSTGWTYYLRDGMSTLAVIKNGDLAYMNILSGTETGRVIASSGTISASGDKRYYITDHLGSTRAVVDQTGTIKENRDYYPFGLIMDERSFVASGDDPTTEQFSGKERDAYTDLDYFGARYYHSGLGRFLSIDRFADKYPSMTPYQYAANNPGNFIDVNGDSVYQITDRAVLDLLGLNNNDHAYLLLTPDDLEAFSESEYAGLLQEYTFTNENGEKVTKQGIIVGAGPSKKSPLDLGYLKARTNEGEDPENPQTGTLLINPGDQTDHEFITNILDNHSNYMDRQQTLGLVPSYSLPSAGEVFGSERTTNLNGFNSNSYVSGIIKASGGVPNNPNRKTPLYNNPVPSHYFLPFKVTYK